MDKAPKKSTRRELVEVAATGAVGSVPVFGSVLATSLMYVLNVAHSRRMGEWFDELAECIDDLERRPTWEELREDDDAVITASRVAAANSQAEKREALRNGVLNTILKLEPEADLRATFLRYVDELTPTHLALLRFMSGPGVFLDQHGIERPHVQSETVRNLLDIALPEIAASPILETVASDLAARGLSHDLGGMMTGTAVFQPRTKPLGDRFLRFVEAPAE
jgi:hypothetical protein